MKTRWKKMVWRRPTVLSTYCICMGRYRTIPLTTSFTLDRSAVTSSVYSGGLRASMLIAERFGL